MQGRTGWIALAAGLLAATAVGLAVLGLAARRSDPASGPAAEWATRRINGDLLPVADAAAYVRARVARHAPEVVVLGDSVALRDLDEPAFARALGRSPRAVERFALPGSGPPHWYALLANHVLPLHTPELVVIVAHLQTALGTTPSTANSRERLEALMTDDEPVLRPRLALGPGRRGWADRVAMGRVRLRDDLLGRLRGRAPPIAPPEERWGWVDPALLPDVSASLLPDLWALAGRAGVRLVLVRPAVDPASPAARADPVPQAVVDGVGDLLGPDWLDLSHEVYGPGSWVDPLHLRPAAASRFGARLGARLRAREAAGAARGPSRIEAGETGVWTLDGAPSRALRVRVAGIGRPAVGVAVGLVGGDPVRPLADADGRLVATLLSPPPPPWRIAIAAPADGPPLEVIDVRAGSGETLGATEGAGWTDLAVIAAGTLPVARTESAALKRIAAWGAAGALDRVPAVPWACVPLAPSGGDCRALIGDRLADRCTDGAAVFVRAGPPPIPSRTCDEAPVVWVFPGDTLRISFPPGFASALVEASGSEGFRLVVRGEREREWQVDRGHASSRFALGPESALFVTNPSRTSPVLLARAVAVGALPR